VTATEHDRPVLVVADSSAGPFNPLLSVVGELKARGVRDVWFASAQERRSLVEGLSGPGQVSFASLGAAPPQSSPQHWDDETYRSLTTGDPVECFARYVDLCTDYDHLRRMHTRCVEIIDEVRPALVVADSFATYAMDAAQTRGVPFVVSISLPPSNFFQDQLPPRYPVPFSGLPARMTPRQQVANGAFRRRLLGELTRPDRMARNMPAVASRKVAGLHNPDMSPAAYTEAAAALMAYTVFDFEYPFPAPEKLRMVGPAVPRHLPPAVGDDELDRWLDGHPSVVYVGFGTIMRPTPGQVEAIVEVAERLAPEHAVLWKLPAAQRHLLPPKLPANLRVEAWLPSQLRVLAHPHVRVFFNHGAANGVHESAYFATPQLVLPFWLDCPDGAARAVDAGVALAVERRDTLDVDEVVGKLRRLLTEETFRQRAQEWSHRMREAGGVVAAADLLLEQRDASTAHRAVVAPGVEVP
jgi:polyene glycosyltransferase